MKLRITMVVGLALFVGCATPAKNKNKEEAQARWEQMRAKVKFQLAERDFAAGQIESALKTCQEVIALHPACLDAYLLLARIQLERGQFAEAQAALDATEQFGPTTPEAAYLRGMLAEARGPAREAMDWYRRAYEALPNEPDYLLAYVESMIAAGQTEAAAELLVKRERDFDQDVRVQLLLGQCLSLLGKHREASDVYLGVLLLEPNDPMLREEAVLVLLSAKRVTEAGRAIAPLLESPQAQPSVMLLQSWAQALLDTNDVAGAVRVLQEATTRYPKAVKAQLLLSKALLMLDRAASAREAARQACRLAPDSVDARLLLAYCCLAAGDREEARTAAQ